MEGEGEGQPVRFIGSPIELSRLRRLACGVGRRASASIPKRSCNELRGKVATEAVMSVRLVIDEHVATVTIGRPEVLNAVDLATEAELQRIWAEIEA